MAFANPNVSDILATTIQSRTRKIRDNVTNNNALLMQLEKKGRIKTVSGGNEILEEISFAENSNSGYYSGYDLLPMGTSDVISAAEYQLKQAAVSIVISGLEQLQNSGKEKFIDLLESRIEVAESTMKNLICSGLYSDGTAANGKQIDGLEAMLPLDPSTGTYGGINSATYPFWRNQVSDQASIDPTAIQGQWNALWAACVRGMDRPDLIVVDNLVWVGYVDSLQAQQRFANTEKADAGFATLKFMNADVVLDGGIGGSAPTGTAFFLNTDYIHYRPHAQRNMVTLGKRESTVQDASTTILAWAGNLTCSGRRYSGRFDGNV